MGYELSIWRPVRDLSDEEAVATWGSLTQGEIPKLLRESPSVAAFTEQLEAATSGDAGQGPWTGGIKPRDSWVTVSCRWSRAEELGPAVLQLAMAHDLGVYDPQMELFYRPPSVTETTDCTLDSPVLLTEIPAYAAIIPGILEALPDREDPYLTVGREDQVYTRMFWTEYGFSMDYRDGGADQRFELIERLPAQVATSLLQDYIAGRSWPEDLRFEVPTA